METQNLWPDFAIAPAKSPKSILKEQAGYLMAKTNNVLSAEVETLQYSDQIIHDFYIVAPAINNYRYNLLRVVHKVFFYPLEISGHGDSCEARDEKEFISELSNMFNHPETKKIISSLLSQSLAE